MVEMMPARSLRMAVATALLFAGVACSGDEPARSTSTPVSPRPAERSSQTVADARRDGVAPEVAALPFGLRVDATSTVRIDDETWAVSRPTRRGAERLGCDAPSDGGSRVDDVCGSEYGELVQLRGRQIVRAYPFAGLPPQHIAITEDAVFCARRGEAGLPDAMVCRVDRDTHELTVRVYPSETDPAFTDGDELPEGWTIDEEHLTISRLAVDDNGVWVTGSGTSWTRLDAETLEIVERDIERVTTDP